MLYGVAQSGPNIVSPSLNIAVLYPGDPYTLFSGTETPVQGMTSVAFQRGPSPSGDNGISFFAQGMPSTSAIDIQASATDSDLDYQSVSGTLTPDANGNVAYTDVGRALFYRVILTTYVSGSMPVVKAQR